MHFVQIEHFESNVYDPMQTIILLGSKLWTEQEELTKLFYSNQIYKPLLKVFFTSFKKLERYFPNTYISGRGWRLREGEMDLRPGWGERGRIHRVKTSYARAEILC